MPSMKEGWSKISPLTGFQNNFKIQFPIRNMAWSIVMHYQSECYIYVMMMDLNLVKSCNYSDKLILCCINIHSVTMQYKFLFWIFCIRIIKFLFNIRLRFPTIQQLKRLLKNHWGKLLIFCLLLVVFAGVLVLIAVQNEGL